MIRWALADTFSPETSMPLARSPSISSVSTSTTLPFPSSPHWTPTMTVAGMRAASVSGDVAARVLEERLARVLAAQRQGGAHLLQAGHRACADLLGELGRVDDVGGDDDRALVLVAGVDDRVELLEDPRCGVLGADVVDVQQVDLGQAVGEVEVAALA